MANNLSETEIKISLEFPHIRSLIRKGLIENRDYEKEKLYWYPILSDNWLDEAHVKVCEANDLIHARHEIRKIEYDRKLKN